MYQVGDLTDKIIEYLEKKIEAGELVIILSDNNLLQAAKSIRKQGKGKDGEIPERPIW